MTHEEQRHAALAYMSAETAAVRESLLISLSRTNVASAFDVHRLASVVAELLSHLTDNPGGDIFDELDESLQRIERTRQNEPDRLPPKGAPR